MDLVESINQGPVECAIHHFRYSAAVETDSKEVGQNTGAAALPFAQSRRTNSVAGLRRRIRHCLGRHQRHDTHLQIIIR